MEEGRRLRAKPRPRARGATAQRLADLRACCAAVDRDETAAAPRPTRADSPQSHQLCVVLAIGGDVWGQTRSGPWASPLSKARKIETRVDAGRSARLVEGETDSPHDLAQLVVGLAIAKRGESCLALDSGAVNEGLPQVLRQPSGTISGFRDLFGAISSGSLDR